MFQLCHPNLHFLKFRPGLLISFALPAAILQPGFFAAETVVWLRGVSFSGTDRTSRSDDVRAALDDWRTELRENGLPAGVSLVVSGTGIAKNSVLFNGFSAMAKEGRARVVDAAGGTAGAVQKRAAAALEKNGWTMSAPVLAAFVRRVAPGLRIAMAGNRRPSEFKGIEIDNYSQSMGHVDKPFLDEVSVRRASGKTTTYYVCCAPARPNTFMSSGPGEAFVCGFYPAACGLDGLLRWAYNSWGEDSNNDMTYSRWTAGDIALVYPDGSPSWRFLELKNGIVAAEKFRILREEGGRDAELDALAAKFDLKKLLEGTDYEGLRRAVQDVVNR